jgi:aryl-alcohol dehydrogenase-like predicted oxidoreductase
MKKRKLGRSGIEVSPLGLGGMPIGGEMFSGEANNEYLFSLGKVNDQEVIQAIHRALSRGINFFDTAPAYGAGHSERLLGKALADRRDKVIIATKFGKKIIERKKWFGRYTTTQEVIGNIRQECEASLRRLKTDYIDLYQFHLLDFPLDQAAEVRGILEELVAEGKIRFYGWSTNDPERCRFFAEGEHCTAIQFRLNALEDTPDLLDICEKYNLAGIVRGPLASGFLTGKYSIENLDDQLSPDDFRLNNRDHIVKTLESLGSIQEILRSNGRSIVQGALAWIWGRSQRTIPIPGFRRLAQVEENLKALEFGPLEKEQLAQIDAMLNR